ncbi:hypothetical protein [Acidovorax sp. Root219]|uniref:hypothetical protein n=1 Tax=Acidovorax sp. Root219 TaxID=1736493 RepID=UPI00070F63BE|nr:hypothetical protein [Acidovorax sp. Root219]KRC28260.1 hypothetical protein ASE28_02540 [Acidovorax sp. Root219]
MLSINEHRHHRILHCQRLRLQSRLQRQLLDRLPNRHRAQRPQRRLQVRRHPRPRYRPHCLPRCSRHLRRSPLQNPLQRLGPHRVRCRPHCQVCPRWCCHPSPCQEAHLPRCPRLRR